MATATRQQTTINQACEELRQLKKLESDAKEAFEILKAKREQAERALIDRMEAEEIRGIKVGDTNFVPAKTIYGQIQDRSLFVEWAEENAPELVEMKERKGPVSELVRQRIDDGEGLPPGVGFYEKSYISQRAA